MANNQARTELVVGIIFFGALAILGIFTIVVSGIGTGPTKTYLVKFPKIYGLKKGDQVRVEGLDKGEVVDLRLNPDAKDRDQIRAKIEVKTDVHIYRDASEVKVTPFSPLGGRIIEITHGTEGPRGEFKSLEQQDEALRNTPRDQRQYEWIQGTAEGELLQTLNDLVDENRPGIARIVSNLAIVSDKLTRTDNVIGNLINDPFSGSNLKDMSQDLAETADHLKQIMKRIDSGKGLVGELVGKGSEKSQLHENVNAAAGYAREALQQADVLLTNANEGKSALGVLVSDNAQVTSDSRSIVHDVSLVARDVAEGQGSLGKLVKDPRFYEGAATTAENLGKITGNLSSNDPTKQSAVGVLLNDSDTGQRVRSTLGHLEAIAASVDKGDGALGLVVKDHEFRDTVQRIFKEVERLTIEFRDSVEDLREQAPVNAFLGAVFAAF